MLALAAGAVIGSWITYSLMRAPAGLLHFTEPSANGPIPVCRMQCDPAVFHVYMPAPAYVVDIRAVKEAGANVCAECARVLST